MSSLPPVDDQTDLYCLTCGYNLRGLPGDPRRCPECGQFNAVAHMLVPPDRLKTKLRELEKAPVQCALCFLGLLVFPIVGFIAVMDDPDKVLKVLFLLAIVFGVWAVQALRFRRRCRKHLGWWRLLLWVHVVVIFLVVLLLLAMFAGFYLIVELELTGWLLLLWPAFLMVAAQWFWLHTGVKRRLDSLQRDLAVALVQEELDSK